jgi:hypothetical protein
LLLLENRFLGVALRAFENKPRSITLVLKPDKNVSDEYFSFEKPAAQHPPLLKASQGKSCWF